MLSRRLETCAHDTGARLSFPLSCLFKLRTDNVLTPNMQPDLFPGLSEFHKQREAAGSGVKQKQADLTGRSREPAILKLGCGSSRPQGPQPRDQPLPRPALRSAGRRPPTPSPAPAALHPPPGTSRGGGRPLRCAPHPPGRSRPHTHRRLKSPLRGGARRAPLPTGLMAAGSSALLPGAHRSHR